ncbi:MAG: helix-turn-helix transcriptional regulator [Clostridiales bacterium]|nr:helix-turn-helix transcriptional regulator [Clostridiales bacterium]
MRDYYYEIGQRIASLRKEHHITQEQFAEIMDISVKHCSEVERGLSSLSLEKLISVSDYFDCSMDYLVHGTDPDNLTLSFPNTMIEIMRSDNEKEKELLNEYLRMYAKLRNGSCNKDSE